MSSSEGGVFVTDCEAFCAFFNGKHFQIIRLACVLAIILICACQQNSSSKPGGSGNQSQQNPATTTTTTVTSTTLKPPSITVTTTTLRTPPTTTMAPTTTTTLPPNPSANFESLVWESASRTQAKSWSQYVFNLVAGEAKALLTAKDFVQFCPNYASLTQNQKVNAAGQLIAAMTKFESGFNPLSRYHESTMGTDPITGLGVYSEGLLQLSYQDTQWAPFCAFNWSVDQYLSATDPKKTILDPYKNLYCGIRILANQVQKKGTIILSSGAYWAVIKSNSQYQKLNEIKAIVSSLSFCE